MLLKMLKYRGENTLCTSQMKHSASEQEVKLKQSRSLLTEKEILSLNFNVSPQLSQPILLTIGLILSAVTESDDSSLKLVGKMAFHLTALKYS